MNKTQNDFGQWVIAVGAPNSIERCKVEHPKKIDWVNGIVYDRASSTPMLHEIELVEDLISFWSVDRITAKLIVQCSDFSHVDSRLRL